MGMTIKESLEWITSRKEHYEMDDNCQELAKALDVAIDTMRKYQKIWGIYERFQKDGDYYHHMAWLDVMEVLKDGNGK